MYLSKTLKGDTACDLRFGELIVPKPLGGHCLRFEIWVAHFAKNLRRTLLAIGDLVISLC